MNKKEIAEIKKQFIPENAFGKYRQKSAQYGISA